MSQISPFHNKKALIAVLLFFCLLPALSGSSSETESRSDLIHIRLSDDMGLREMPDALFLHDKHTRALPDQDCSTCHLKEENAFVFKFNRIRNAGYDADKNMYHEKCTGCHQEKRNLGIKSGPLTVECRLCHSRTPDYENSAQPFGLDKSLHYRHVISSGIPGTGNEKDWNCGACHHEYDKTLKKTFYEKGRESTCRYCHKEKSTNDTRSFKNAAHDDCINCHFRIKSDNQKAGPVECAGCHDAINQSTIEALEDVPRIKRNQPDAVLLSFWMKTAIQSGTPSTQFIEGVAFDHKSHESGVNTCYTCHHASLESCYACHTRMGTEKSEFTRLETAMHTPESMSSCIGCHQSKVKNKNCAGCHAQMGKKSFADMDCGKCHSISRKSLEPVPANGKDNPKIAESALHARQTPPSPIPDKDIPETVTIDIMKDEYEGAVLPHRKIIKTLHAGIQGSDLAVYFHGDALTLCTGCHHNSPASNIPPKCAACHGISAVPEPDGRPGLKGAYHGQCIRCHQEMGIENPAATDCVSCHKLPTRSVPLPD